MSRQGQRPPCGHPDCGWRASRPSGLCGHHDNQQTRADERARALAARTADRSRRLAATGAAARSLWRVGVQCRPGLYGVLLDPPEAERLARLLARHGAVR